MKNWYSITNKSDSESEICIYDEIGMWGVSAKDFLNEMKAVGGRKIVLRINSPGGEVFDGLAIYNRLKEHGPGVEVRIDGVAASMASVIAMAGAPIKMAENALMMIHNPSGLCIGNADDMRELADMLDKVRGSLTGAYERKTGKSQEEIIEMMDAETWLSASECEAMGFIDEITGANKIAASFNRLKIEGKLAEREKAVDLMQVTCNKESMPDESTPAEPVPQEPPAPAPVAEVQETPPATPAPDVVAIAAAAVADERNRVTAIRAWASAVSNVQKIDLTQAVEEFTANGKSLAEFKEHVITNTFKATPLATPTDSNAAAGKTMKREAFAAMSPADQSAFSLSGGKIVE